MPYTVHLESFPGCSLAIVRRSASIPQLSKVIPDACGQVWTALSSQKIPGAGRHVAVYLDNDINLEIGVELQSPLVAPIGDVLPSSLPAGTVATTTHLGPYHLLGQAHDAIHQWCKSHGHQLIRPCWETYGHWLDEWNQDPSKIRTDVFYLLKPTG